MAQYVTVKMDIHLMVHIVVSCLCSYRSIKIAPTCVKPRAAILYNCLKYSLGSEYFSAGLFALMWMDIRAYV
jgi:hypothetical protein